MEKEIRHKHDESIETDIKNNQIDYGIFCFSKWLSSEEGNITDELKIILRNQDKENDVKLFDVDENSEVNVIFENGIPFCKKCQTDDCAHTGFAICVKQNIPNLEKLKN
ncbi:MAG: hypothetical protein DA328_05010 [Nitrososphaeraceae archaeon]|nr:hypothetical protein [Nitrososphaeraceae archaeon]